MNDKRTHETNLKLEKHDESVFLLERFKNIWSGHINPGEVEHSGRLIEATTPNSLIKSIIC